MLRPSETLLSCFLAYYYVKLLTPGLDRERSSTLDSQVDSYYSLMFTKCLQIICIVLFFKFKLR